MREFFVGANEDAAYVKALEKREKDARKSHSQRFNPYSAPQPGPSRPYRPRNSFRAEPNWSSQNWGANQGQQQFNHQGGFVQPPSPAPMQQSFQSATQQQASGPSSTRRCLNCGSPNHFIRDCPTRPSFPMALNRPQ